MRPKLLVIGAPGYRRGGNLRCLRAVREYSKHFDVYLLTPAKHHPELLEDRVLADLSKRGATLAGYFYNSLAAKTHIENLLTNHVIPSVFPKVYSKLLLDKCKFDAVFVEHENLDYVIMGVLLSQEQGIAAGVLLQNPPFLGSPERVRNLLRIHLLWRSLTSGTVFESILNEVKITYRLLILNHLFKHTYESLLKRYNLVLGVSKATLTEMGTDYLVKSNFKFLDPGVALNEEDVAYIHKVRNIAKEKALIVFKGGFAVEKGLLDVLLAFKLILRERKDSKLYVTGAPHPTIVEGARKVCRKFGIENKVVFTGFLDKLNVLK